MSIEIMDLMHFKLNKTLEVQDKCWAKIVHGGATNKLILAEHEPIYTAGQSAGQSFELLQGCFKNPLWDLPCPCWITGRGGLATYQGPGILSVYCVFKMSDFNPRQFNDLLLASAEEVLKFFNVFSHRDGKNPGLYIGEDKKIVSVGLKYARGVTGFGMALSIDPDSLYLEPLIPCGIAGVRLTSLRDEIGREPDDLERVTIRAILYSKIDELFKKITHG